MEIPARHTETSTLYANPDGKTFRLELNVEPVRVKNPGSNAFTPIDTTLVRADGVIRPKAAKGELALSAGGDTAAIKSKDAGAKAGARIDAPGKLPEPALNGSTATYPSVYGNGIDLVVTATPSGFRQQIVIRQRPAEPVAFRVPIDLPRGLSFYENAKKRPTLRSEDGKRTLEIKPAALLDAVAADPNGDIGSGRVGRAAVTLSGSALTYRPDLDFLSDPGTMYPVTMIAADDDWWDCTLGDCPDGVGESMDTYINDVDLTESWDTFTRDQMWVGKSYASNVAKRWRGYIQFPMPRATDPFWGSEIENADLELWNYLSNDCGEFVGSGITARRITSDWDELTLSWSDQPSVTNEGADNEQGAYSPDCSGSMNYEHDLIHSVDEIVQKWADGETNYGFQLRAGDESELRNWRRYRTREQTSGYPAHGPRLAVDFLPEPPPVEGAAVMLDPGEPVPTTQEEFAALASRGRLSSTAPEPDPSTYAEHQQVWESTTDSHAVSADDLQHPLPAPTEGGKAHWSFDESTGVTAADDSGAHPVTLNEGTSWEPGISGTAISTVPESEALARVSAAAKRSGKAIEVSDRTTPTSITHAMPDGSVKTEITAGPVRTRRNGAWVPIDTTLTEQGGSLRPQAIASHATLEISAGGTDVFAKLNAEGKSYALRWPTPLPKPTVKGAVATYTDAAGAGADLVVTALPAGFRHEVVLRQRPAKQVELRIGVEDEGLTLSQGKGGRLLLKGRDKKLVAAGTRPVVSSGGVRGRLASVKHGKAGVDMVTKDGRTDLVVKPDQKFLADAATMYPVRVAAAVTLPLAADVDVSTYETESPADPGLDTLVAGTVSDGSKYRTHLRFDTTGLQGSTVTGATLSLINFDAHNCGAALSRGIQVARLTSGWDEDNLYWGTKPAFTTEDASTNFKGVNLDCEVWPDSMEWNVTGIAQDWAAGAANHGLVLKSPNETNVDNYRLFDSSEYFDPETSPPTLTVTTGAPASQPAVSAPAITPAQTVDGTTVTTSLTPQLSATVTDTAGGNLTGQFEVEHDPAATGQGSGQIWTGSSPAVASGGQATAGVPAGKLTDGWKIRWRARAANATASTTSVWTDWQSATVDVPNPTVGAFRVTPSHVVDEVTVATSLTPGLRATVTDPAAQPLRAEFEIEHDPAATGQGSGQIWAGAVDGVASGTQATATVPGGELTDGWRVRWRTRAVNTATTVGSPWSAWQNLTIDVPDPVSEPAVGVLQVNPSEQVDGTTVTPTRTPALLAQVLDPAGQPLRAEVEVEHDPNAPTEQGTGQIWAGSADNVPAGTQANIAVPADTLSDGWQVRWRARAVSATTTSAWSDWQQVTVNLPKPTVTDPQITPSKVVDGQTVTGTLTPTLTATVADPDGQPVQVTFEVEHDPDAADEQGSGRIWTGDVGNVSSGTRVALPVPAGNLSDGWLVRWRVRASGDAGTSPWSPWQQVRIDLTATTGPLAQTSAPVIHTNQSFTVAGWVKWAGEDDTFTVLEQTGTQAAAFRLGYEAERGLVFTLSDADSGSAAWQGVISMVEPPVGHWFHLTAVYSREANTATLYLNGSTIGLPEIDDEDAPDDTLTASVPIGFPAWDATGPLVLGAGLRGSVDEAWVYDRALTSSEILALYDAGTASPPASASRTKNRATAAMPPQPMRYDRVTTNDCYQRYKGNGLPPVGNPPPVVHWAKNHFSSCVAHGWALGQGDDVMTGTLYLIGSTTNGLDGAPSGGTARDITFDAYVRHVEDDDNDFYDADITFGMKPEKTQRACTHVTTYNGRPHTNHVTKKGWDIWGEGRDDDLPWVKIATFRFRSPPGSAPGEITKRDGNTVANIDLISSCDLLPYVSSEGTLLAPIRNTWKYGSPETKYAVRCDSASYISLQFQGGCVFPSVASLELKLGQNYDTAYKHYWKACYDQADTYPKKPSKHIKGCATSTNGRPDSADYLHRVGDPHIDRNRARATYRCRSLWPHYGTPVIPMVAQDCDEFPFASVAERTKAEDKNRNFSVCTMPGGASGPNQVAGAVQTRFYNRDRILHDDALFVRFATKLQPSPAQPTNTPMDSLCWKAPVGKFTNWP